MQQNISQQSIKYLEWASIQASKKDFDMSHTGKKQLSSYDNSLYRGVIIYYLNTTFGVSSEKIGKLLQVNKTLGTYWTNRVRDLSFDKDPNVEAYLQELQPPQ